MPQTIEKGKTTTEFWGKVAIQGVLGVLALAMIMKGDIDGPLLKVLIGAIAGLEGTYGIARSIRKK